MDVLKLEILEGGRHKIELTRRNLNTLLAKLDDPNSARTLIDGSWSIEVHAVEDEEHYADRPPGEVYMSEGKNCPYPRGCCRYHAEQWREIGKKEVKENS